MALHTFRLPDPGEGLVEADIVTWRVAVGDQVKINDILVEVETSKSLVELPTPYAGTVTELLVNEGDTVDVGSPIISIDDGLDAAPPAEPNGDGSEAQVPNLVGYGPRTGTAKRRPRRGAGDGPVETHDQIADTFSTHAPVSRRADDREPLQAEQDAPTGAPLPGPGETAPAATPSGGAVLAKPPVRKLAKDLGVDLGSLVGSGPGGVITRDDVTAASRASRSPRGDRRSGGSSSAEGGRANPDQGGTQIDGGCDGALSVQRTPCLGVVGLRRDRHDAARGAAQDSAGVC